MTKRLIKPVRNGRDVLYGVHSKKDGRYYWASQEDGEAVKYTIDMKQWMDEDETITDVTEAGSAQTEKELTDTSVTYMIKKAGCIESLITTSTGETKVVNLHIVEPCTYVRDSYRSDGYWG